MNLLQFLRRSANVFYGGTILKTELRVQLGQ